MDRLERENPHPRDSYVSLDKNAHKYKIGESIDYISVTNLIKEQFDEFDADLAIDNMMRSEKWKEGHKWWGRSKQELKIEWNSTRNDASHEGELLHHKLEKLMNDPELPYPYYFKDLKLEIDPDLEWSYVINFIKSFPDLQPYRTEWKIYDEEAKVAGCIDLLCKIKDTNLFILIDYKRSKAIKQDNPFKRYSKNPILEGFADNNFTHYALQQNMYRYILLNKYKINIIKMMLVRIHPDSSNFELIEIPDWSKEIFDLFEERKIK